jgi:peptidoglycan/LPS O-acetylase OafA/YrhL
MATGTAIPTATNGKLLVSDHLPSLDGLRAISIAMVLLGHVGGTASLGRINLGIGATRTWAWWSSSSSPGF